MSPSKVFVTTATGVQGGGVVRYCLRDGHIVYALVRNPSSQAAKSLSDLGAKLVEGSLEDVESLIKGMQNTDAAFLNLPGSGPQGMPPNVEYTKNFIKAAHAASVPWIFCSTVVNAGQHESIPGWGPDNLMYKYWLVKDAVENLVRSSGLQRWTILRPATFMQNLQPPSSQFLFPGFDERRVLRTAYDPEAKVGWIDGADVGKAVAKALLDPDKYSGREIDLAAENLTIGELAEEIGKGLGKPVTIEPYTDDELAKMGPSVQITAQRWASDVPTGLSAETAAVEFGLTSVKEFFVRDGQF
ncbi:NAD dependent epimerase/dehydratase [Annulohypoxylon truncatum]|uniref:NAD dependent epimerase/dehydratase n=1 Tax=Annulohypoxylon truncatum TaxID=327061 RepID=UPI002008AD19|nr:NAD dependent epimerase/dehydratase [Annulohypoxylon truncatum]KAI1206721.1 NAD dependent epimerase/dehydratase [Annulohypoxylon truncatum]